MLRNCMRAMVFWFVVLAASSSAAASTSTETCKSISGVAQEVMKSRQQGILMAELMEVEVSDLIKPLMHQYIVRAYETPRFRTPQNQQRAVTDFANDAYLACIKQRKD